MVMVVALSQRSSSSPSLHFTERKLRIVVLCAQPNIVRRRRGGETLSLQLLVTDLLRLSVRLSSCCVQTFRSNIITT